MSTARAIQTSITHVSIGIVMGTIVESLMPAYSASSSIAMQAFEAFVQVGLNGVLIAQVASQLGDEDPTFGMPFSLGLFEAQPGLAGRIAVLSSAAKRQGVQAVQRMAPPVVGEASPN